MIGIRFAAAALLLTVATPASAQTLFGRNGGWEIARNRTGCTLTHTAKDHAATRIAIGRSTDGSTWMEVDRAGWPFAGAKPALLALMANGATIAGGSATFHAKDGRSGFMIWLLDGEFANVLAPGTIKVVIDKPERSPSFAMPPGAFTERDLDRCIAEVRLGEHGSGAPAVTPPRLHGAQEALMTPEDYPPASVRSQTSGTVTVRLTVNAYGYVSDCAVTVSSGSTVLDIRTCAIYRRRARFEPALDANGHATIGSYDFTKQWIAPPALPEININFRRD